VSLRRQAGRFLVVGVVATVADFSTLTALWSTGLAVFAADYVHLPPDVVAKSGAFVVGTTVAWHLNRVWTFADTTPRAGQGLRFLALYLTTFGLNVGTYHVALSALAGFGAAGHTVAFLAATATSTLANFVGQRTWVFR
jgi:putative flippase GtrA